MTLRQSPFFHPGACATADEIAIVHLKKDLQLPTILKDHDEDDEGYSEGKVVNTRFGSFPHTKLIGLPWGTQVRASKVDTGSRGRRGQKKTRQTENSNDEETVEDLDILNRNGDTHALLANEEGVSPNLQGRKRVQEELDSEGFLEKRQRIEGESGADQNRTSNTVEEQVENTGPTGFIHLLPPTPENWTSSLPHRTQVVYTPDYSYVLHRIRARPGSNIIEAGAGSGSFTHASARAVYTGHDKELSTHWKSGKVWSFEFHEQRHEKLQEEIRHHGLDGIVEVTHRDVCEEGFLVNGQSPKANAIFLDLPAPWLALPHLTRSKTSSPANAEDAKSSACAPFISALNISAPVHICTFSPCIEQVQRTVSVMRQLGWVDIEVVEVANKRFEIRRDRIGIDNGAHRGLQVAPATVEEALRRLVEVEGTFRAFHENGDKVEVKKKDARNPNNRDRIIESLVEKKAYKEGKLVHRTEPEVKTHTSYLVFAVLPQEWTEEDEIKARERWPVKVRDAAENNDASVIGMSKRQLKKAARMAQKEQAARPVAPEGNTGEICEAKEDP